MTPEEILSRNADTYRRKNADYGNSWRLVGETMALWLRHAGVEELRVPADPGSLNGLGLFTRRLDKVIRAFNAEYVVDELNFESTADAHEDESTYSAMHASLLREREAAESKVWIDPERRAEVDGGWPTDENGRRIRPEYQAAYEELVG